MGVAADFELRHEKDPCIDVYERKRVGGWLATLEVSKERCAGTGSHAAVSLAVTERVHRLLNMHAGQERKIKTSPVVFDFGNQIHAYII